MVATWMGEVYGFRRGATKVPSARQTPLEWCKGKLSVYRSTEKVRMLGAGTVRL